MNKDMIFPVRCFTCGKVIGSMWKRFQEEKESTGASAALDSMGIKKYCCRRMFLTHVELIDQIVKY